MPPTLIYPDLDWYSRQSQRKALPGRCPYANIERCPRFFESVALLSDAKITSSMAKELHDRTLAKWREHELWPATGETSASITGGEVPNSYSNFCPEVTYNTFRLFATSLIGIGDDPIDRQLAEEAIEKNPAPPGKDWRWSWTYVEPLHFSDCPLFAQLQQEKKVSDITFTGPVTGNVNVAGHTISAPVMTLSFADLLSKIEASNASIADKEDAKSKLAELLSHPLVTSILGGIAGSIGG